MLDGLLSYMYLGLDLISGRDAVAPADTSYLELDRPFSTLLTVHRSPIYRRCLCFIVETSTPASLLTLTTIPLYYRVLAFKLGVCSKNTCSMSGRSSEAISLTRDPLHNAKSLTAWLGGWCSQLSKSKRRSRVIDMMTWCTAILLEAAHTHTTRGLTQ